MIVNVFADHAVLSRGLLKITIYYILNEDNTIKEAYEVTEIDDIFFIVCEDHHSNEDNTPGWTWNMSQKFCFTNSGFGNSKSLIKSIIENSDEPENVKDQFNKSGIDSAIMLDGGGNTQLYYFVSNNSGKVAPNYPIKFQARNLQLGVSNAVRAYTTN